MKYLKKQLYKLRPGFSFQNLLTQSVRKKSGSAFHNLADTEERKRIKTITGCCRFIEGQIVISTNIMRRRLDRKLGCFSYAVAGKSFKNRLLYYEYHDEEILNACIA